MEDDFKPLPKTGLIPARMALAIAAVLVLLGGGIWLVIDLANDPQWKVVVPSGDMPPAKARALRPSGPTPVTIKLASLPWRRSVNHPTPVLIPLAHIPFHRSFAHPTPVSIATAGLPYVRHLGEAPAYIELASLPWDNDNHPLPIAPIHRQKPDWQHPFPVFVPLASIGVLQPRQTLADPVPMYVATATLPRSFGVGVPRALVARATLTTREAQKEQADVKSLATRWHPDSPVKQAVALQAAAQRLLDARAAVQASQQQVQEQQAEQLRVAAGAASAHRRQKEIEIYEQTHLPKFMMSLCRDLDGNLWVGAEDDPEEAGEFGSLNTGGVWRYDVRKQWWTHFTTKDGLGDDNGYAVACDRKGRVWAGHLNHGVSVYNGERWQCYEVVGGISRPDTLSGPLGERIFHITVNPKDGDVWIATNAGLARYSESKDTWSYYTRAEGLPSDQANSMAFDRDGNIYVATQCNGVAMADAADEYAKWRQVTGPEEEPAAAAGDGIPGNLTNDVLVAKDGTVYLATDAGLGISWDKGKHWRFVRGQDWADKVKGRYGGPPKGWKDVGVAALAEDYCTFLKTSETGVIQIGHRETGCEELTPGNWKIRENSSERLRDTTSAIEFLNSVVISSYGEGFLSTGRALSQSMHKSTTLDVDEEIPLLPSGAPSTLAADLVVSLQAKSTASDRRLFAEFLGEDWTTQGDWTGRYGRAIAVLCANSAPWDAFFISIHGYVVDPAVGPVPHGTEVLRRWIQWSKTDDGRVLYDPYHGYRREAEWDDHGETRPNFEQGPDLWISADVPKGIHRISLYFFNKDGHTKPNSRRDYIVTIHAGASSLSDAVKSPALTRARTREFWGGVYKQFAVSGPARYWIHIDRNHSLNSICSGVFIDRMDGISSSNEYRPLASMGNVHFDPPIMNSQDAYEEKALSINLSAALQAAWNTDVGCRVLRGYTVLVCRSEVAADVHSHIVDFCRWRLSLWKPFDRAQFNEIMADAMASYRILNQQGKVDSHDKTH